MTVKEWLQRARFIDKEVEALKEQKNILYSELTKATAPTDGERTGGGKGSGYEERLAKYTDLCIEIDKGELALLDVKKEIIQAIKQVNDSLYRTILYERYINFKMWYQIAQVVNFSDKHIIQVLHPRALQCVRIKEEQRN